MKTTKSDGVKVNLSNSYINPARIIKNTADTQYKLYILRLSLDFTESEVQKTA
jgi:hypothetical protein